MFKKTAIAVAVAGAVSVPVSALADGHSDHDHGGPTVYGFVNIGVENLSISGQGDGKIFGDGGTSSLVFGTGVDGSTHANDIANTRFGFKGSKDLGNGLSSSYKIEIGTGTTSGGRGGPVEDAAPWDKRLAQIGISGGFGSLTLGNQWGLLYEYLGWNVYRFDGHGGAAYYDTTRLMRDDAYGLRVSNAYTYKYGGGGYSSDPFTFSVQAILNPDEAPGGNDETVDSLTVGAAVSFGPVTLTGLVMNQNDGIPGAAEPSLKGFGVRYQATDSLYLGASHINVDRDTPSTHPDDAKSLSLTASYDFGGGVSGMLVLGSSETGQSGVGDSDSMAIQVQKALGSATKVYLEWETADRDLGAAGEHETTVLSVAVKSSF